MPTNTQATTNDQIAHDAIDRLDTIADHVATNGVDDVNELVDWIDEVSTDLEDRLDDPDQGDSEPLYRGLYMLADTPLTLHPVLTEDGGGDQGILTEMLAEEGVGAFGAARENPRLTDAVLETVDELEDYSSGAPFADVLDQVAETKGMYSTLAVVHDMLRTGRLYAPDWKTLRTTDYEPDHERGLHA